MRLDGVCLVKESNFDKLAFFDVFIFDGVQVFVERFHHEWASFLFLILLDQDAAFLEVDLDRPV